MECHTFSTPLQIPKVPQLKTQNYSMTTLQISFCGAFAFPVHAVSFMHGMRLGTTSGLVVILVGTNGKFTL